MYVVCINVCMYVCQEEEDLADSRATIAVNRKHQKNLDFERNQQCGNVMRQLIEAGSVLEDMFASSSALYTYCTCLFTYKHTVHIRTYYEVFYYSFM